MAGEPNRYASVDLGASGGTVYTGQITRDELAVAEVARFDNRPVEDGDRYVWDVHRLVEEIRAGLRQCEAEHGAVDSVGVDAWGTDFGLLADGELLRLPYSYREPSLGSTRDALFDRVDRRTVFDHTGIAHWDAATTLYHCHYLAQEEPDVLDSADQLLLMPQLLSFLLGADPSCEETVASTTQLLDPETRDWATELLSAVDLPADLFPAVEPAGRTVGTVAPDDGWTAGAPGSSSRRATTRRPPSPRSRSTTPTGSS